MHSYITEKGRKQFRRSVDGHEMVSLCCKSPCNLVKFKKKKPLQIIDKHDAWNLPCLITHHSPLPSLSTLAQHIFHCFSFHDFRKRFRSTWSLLIYSRPKKAGTEMERCGHLSNLWFTFRTVKLKEHWRRWLRTHQLLTGVLLGQLSLSLISFPHM